MPKRNEPLKGSFSALLVGEALAYNDEYEPSSEGVK